MEGKPLSSLSRSSDYDEFNEEKYDENKFEKSSWVTLVIWFVIIAVIIWFILFSLRPNFILKKDESGEPTDEIDGGKVLLWSVVISLIVVVIIWFIWSSGSDSSIYPKKHSE